MSFDINQLGPAGHGAATDSRRTDQVAEEPHGHGANGTAGQNGTHGRAPLRNGALKRELDAANETVGELIELTQRLSFEVDEASGAVVVRVLDEDTGETERIIPGDEFLELHERLDEIRFLLVDDVG